MRIQKESDFFVELPEIGTFRFGRRTFLDRAKIRADYLRIVKDLGDDDSELSAYAAIIASYKALCVECPTGWENIEEIELNTEKDKQIFDLFDLVQAAESSFRKGAEAGSQA